MNAANQTAQQLSSRCFRVRQCCGKNIIYPTAYYLDKDRQFLHAHEQSFSYSFAQLLEKKQ